MVEEVRIKTLRLACHYNYITVPKSVLVTRVFITLVMSSSYKIYNIGYMDDYYSSRIVQVGLVTPGVVA
jgi:hypothetical protein